MNLRELEYVVALAEEKNLTKAAYKLFITPSALTQQVLRLEKDLNTSLFIRSRTGWKLTEAGKIYLETARKILFLKEDAYKQIQDVTKQKSYTLTIGIPPERGSVMFSAVYPYFREKYPEITIHLREIDVRSQQELISAGHLDLGFLTLAVSQRSQDEYQVLQKEEILIAVPYGYPDELLEPQKPSANATYPIISLKCLRNEPFAMMSSSSTFRRVQEDIFRQNGIQPTQSFETARARTIFELISYNLCCSLVCEYHLQYLQPKKAKAFAMPEHPTWDTVVSYRKGKYLSEAENYFIQLVKAYFEGTLKPGK